MTITKDITPDTELMVGDIILDSLGQERKVLAVVGISATISDILGNFYDPDKYFTTDNFEMVRQGYKYKIKENNIDWAEFDKQDQIIMSSND